MKKYTKQEILKMIKFAVDEQDKLRRQETAMLLGEINKLKDAVCKGHVYELQGMNYIDHNLVFLCSKCGRRKVIEVQELNDKWVSIIVEKNLDFYIRELQHGYENRKKIREDFKIKE
jgi:ferredoxin-like protein FixX